MESTANLGLFAVQKNVSEYAERIYAYMEKTPRATKLLYAATVHFFLADGDLQQRE